MKVIHVFLLLLLFFFFFFFFSSTSLLLPTRDPPPSCMHAQSCNPMDCSQPGSSVHGLFQAKILEWVAISFSNMFVFKTNQYWLQAACPASACALRAAGPCPWTCPYPPAQMTTSLLATAPDGSGMQLLPVWQYLKLHQSLENSELWGLKERRHELQIS